MSWVMLGITVVGGVSKMVQASQGRKARIKEQEDANKELARRKREMDNLEITNPYANLENVYEDLTVNQQQVEFMQQQNQMQQANQMQQMRAAAGGAGVAGLAQAMANQGQIAAQKTASVIGQQEQANQMAAARGEASVPQQRAAGEVSRQTRQGDLTGDLLEMSMGRKAAADDARSAAATQMWQGASEIVGGVGQFGQQNMAEGNNFWGN